MNTIKRTLIASSVALIAGQANAASVADTLFAGLQQLSDNSAEVLINAGGGADTILDVGDRLRTILDFNTVEQAPNPNRSLGLTSGNNELSAISDIVVVAKVVVIPDNPLTPLPDGVYDFVFGPSGALAAEFGVAAGAMAVFFEDSVSEFTRVTGGTCTSPAISGDCEDNLNDGSIFAVVGFSGAAGEIWVARASTDDVALAALVAAPGNSGTFNYALNELGGGTFSSRFGPVACGIGTIVEVCGSGSILGVGGVTTPYDVFDNTDLTINVVPEPATLALLGMGLLGAGVFSRRRQG